MKYNRKTEWKTHLGNSVTAAGIDDQHLANTIQFLTFYDNNPSMLRVFKKEAKLRGLSKEFLGKSQYPYKDGKGNYIVWDFCMDQSKVVGSYARN